MNVSELNIKWVSRCRLLDCIELLEDMERQKSLDMDQVVWCMLVFICFLFYFYLC